MDWQPAHDHITQMRTNPDGTVTGRNDCFEASLARYLRETAAGHPGLPESDTELIDAISLDARGIPDQEYQPPTTLPEADRALRRFGISPHYTTDYQDALTQTFAICLVDGTALAPARYPAEWFAGEAGSANHFILWLPRWNGALSWFDDPLCGADCTYDLVSVREAFYGAYLLPDSERPSARLAYTSRPCALKATPDHYSVALAHLQKGASVTIKGQPQRDWVYAGAAGRFGYLPWEVLTPTQPAPAEQGSAQTASGLWAPPGLRPAPLRQDSAPPAPRVPASGPLATPGLQPAPEHAAAEEAAAALPASSI
jgi:hypothetical protein